MIKTAMCNNETLTYKIENLYKLCGFEFSGLAFEVETNQYEACIFLLNEKVVIYRTAKITPKKVGQFAAIWKRNDLGVSIPYHANEDFDFMMISVKTKDHFGQFIFSKKALIENGIISTAIKEGKRGFRLYSPWDEVLSNQALKTQKWQSKYFVNFSEFEVNNIVKAKTLLNSKS